MFVLHHSCLLNSPLSFGTQIFFLTLCSEFVCVERGQEIAQPSTLPLGVIFITCNLLLCYLIQLCVIAENESVQILVQLIFPGQ